jgi:hypothetical protein
MPKCPNCKQSVKTDWKICVDCGHPLGEKYHRELKQRRVIWWIVFSTLILFGLMVLGGEYLLPFLAPGPTKPTVIAQVTNTPSAPSIESTPDQLNTPVPTLNFKQPGVDTLKIDLWPEFDQPGVLVIYNIKLLPQIKLPTELAIRLPVAAGKPSVVAVRQADGSLLAIDYHSQIDGEWMVINFTATTLEIQLEYYDPNLKIEDVQRNYSFHWPGDLAVNSVTLSIQLPYDGKNMTFLPSIDFNSQIGNDGMTYYQRNIGSLAFGQEFNISIYYQKSTEILSSLFRKGNVLVEINNGSGGNAPLNLPVTLYGFDNTTLIFTETINTATNGYYTFSNIDMPIGRVFMAGVDYLGVTYGSDTLTPGATDNESYIPITIYEATTDTSFLSIDRLHIILDFTYPNIAQITEMYIITNHANRAVIAAEKGGPVTIFNLPSDSYNLQMVDGILGDRYKEIPNGFTDTQPVKPGAGNHQVAFTYDMPYSNELEFSHLVSYSVQQVEILLQEVGMGFEGDQFVFTETRNLQGKLYKVYTRDGLDQNSII